MPKPQGTYLRIQENERSRFDAEQSRRVLTQARVSDLDAFYKALDRVPERELDRWHRSMALLVDKLKKGKPLAKEDEDRETVSKAIGQVRKVVEQVKDLRQLEGRLNVPLEPVLRASTQPSAVGAELALVIALCQVFEVLVRLRRRK